MLSNRIDQTGNGRTSFPIPVGKGFWQRLAVLPMEGQFFMGLL
jgi:hypothetical protein